MTLLLGNATSVTVPLAWVVAALIGAGLGWLLTAALDRLLVRPWAGVDDPGFPPLRGTTRRLMQGAAVAAAVASWWWETQQAVGSPPGFGADWAAVACRWAGHAVLFTLLAAAATVDVRHRVIPDLVTVTGVVLGLLWAFIAPNFFLPVVVLEPRSFAAPVEVADVLGLTGGLHVIDLPSWLAARPAVAGLAICLKIWLGWWFACTAPFLGSGPSSTSRRLREPRTIILVAGSLLVCGAWWQGGDRWAAVVTALVGLAVGGGMIWGIRTAASLAMGREAMGMGDVTLMAMIGTWIGWQACLLVLYCTVFVGLTHALVHLVRRGETEFPFGPSLCLATVLVILFWRPLWLGTGRYLEDPLVIAAVAAFVIVGSAGFLWVLRLVRERDRAVR